jgi:hypothetical protein
MIIPPPDSRLGAGRRDPLATQNEGFSVWVAAMDQHPVGFITAVDRYIDLLFVAPEYGRRVLPARYSRNCLRRYRMAP